MVGDFETRWDSKSGYTLSKMTTESYIRDPRFKAFGFGFQFIGDARPHWVSHDDLSQFFESIDWETTAVMCHNAMFDAAIMSWLYDAHPAFIFDTLCMARALYGVEVGNSAKLLAQRFGLTPKGTATESTDGLIELPPAVEDELAAYCLHDVYLCGEFFKNMSPGFPTKEFKLIDMTVKMFTEPRLVLDAPLLEQALSAEEAKRTALLRKFKVSDKDLGNNETLAGLMAMLGFKPPEKRSPTNPKKTVYAFAKSDAGFQALLNSENEDIAMLCQARLAVKSTGERARAVRFKDIASRGTLPVPLKYYCAHTGRWGGAELINLQNLKRGGLLRDSIMAPEGYQLVVCDLSQIEPRVLAAMSGYEALLDIFRSGQDAYSLFGRQVFNEPTLAKESHPLLRQSAKSILLGCGFGMGWANFAGQLMVGFLGAPPVRYDKAFAKQAGVSSEDITKFIKNEELVARMMEIPHTCSTEELVVHCVASATVIKKYRAAAEPVTDFWAHCDNMIRKVLGGDGEPEKYSCVEFQRGRIRLPSGMFLKYPDLRKVKDADGKTEWVYGKEGRLYGPRLVENIVQSVARVVMTDGMVRIQNRYPCVLTVHDEVVCLVPETEVQDAMVWVREQMIKEPRYLPGIPLDAEVGAGERYGVAK